MEVFLLFLCFEIVKIAMGLLDLQRFERTPLRVLLREWIPRFLTTVVPAGGHGTTVTGGLSSAPSSGPSPPGAVRMR